MCPDIIYYSLRYVIEGCQSILVRSDTQGSTEIDIVTYIIVAFSKTLIHAPQQIKGPLSYYIQCNLISSITSIGEFSVTSIC